MKTSQPKENLFRKTQTAFQKNIYLIIEAMIEFRKFQHRHEYNNNNEIFQFN